VLLIIALQIKNRKGFTKNKKFFLKIPESSVDLIGSFVLSIVKLKLSITKILSKSFSDFGNFSKKPGSKLSEANQQVVKIIFVKSRATTT